MFALIGLLSVAPLSADAQQEVNPNQLGLTCEKILAMKAEEWSEYSNKRDPGGENGYDQAYVVYADCMRIRNDSKLAKLPTSAQKRIRKYRDLCATFRVSMILLFQAYAGGGTIFTHSANRGGVIDEALIAKLTDLNQKTTLGRAVVTKSALSKIRRKILGLNPDTLKNHKSLTEFSMTEQAISNYKEVLKSFKDLSALLSTEPTRPANEILKYMKACSEDNFS